jgi:tyrosyl-tRNA synthetase
VPSSTLSKSQLENSFTTVDLMVSSGMAKSKGEARRAIDEGGISLNNHRVMDSAQFVTTTDLIDGQFLVLRRGKKNYQLVKIN